MLIWSGLGYLAALITFGACMIAQVIVDARFGEGYYSNHYWAVGLALVLGGAVSALIGFLLKTRTDREVIDANTNVRLVINQSQHSFFFLPLPWAGTVISLIGIAVATSDVMR